MRGLRICVAAAIVFALIAGFMSAVRATPILDPPKTPEKADTARSKTPPTVEHRPTRTSGDPRVADKGQSSKPFVKDADLTFSYTLRPGTELSQRIYDMPQISTMIPYYKEASGSESCAPGLPAYRVEGPDSRRQRSSILFYNTPGSYWAAFSAHEGTPGYASITPEDLCSMRTAAREKRALCDPDFDDDAWRDDWTYEDTEIFFQLLLFVEPKRSTVPLPAVPPPSSLSSPK